MRLKYINLMFFILFKICHWKWNLFFVTNKQHRVLDDHDDDDVDFDVGDKKITIETNRIS